MPYTCCLAEDAGESEKVYDGDGGWVRYSLVRMGDGSIVRWSDAPIGTMVVKPDCQYPDCRGHERGGRLMVKLPNPNDTDRPQRGIAWSIDHPSSDGCIWQRQGEPPT